LFNLTREEKQVVLFIVSLVLIGMGIDFLSKKYSPVQHLLAIDKDMGRIDLNTADKNALLAVSGLGEKLSQRIIEYRESHSGFRDIAELKNVRGITEYRYEKIKDAFIIR
jgi:competence ComEA-like helix-hairpin-helix protein